MKTKLLIIFLLLAPALAACLTQVPPTAVITPAKVEGGPDITRDFTVNVTSNNPCDFGPGDCRDTFLLRNITPTGWNATFSRGSVEVSCRESNSSSIFSVTPKDPYVMIGHSYEVEAEAYYAAGAGRGSATYYIPPCSGLRCCGDRLCDTGGYPPENRTNCPTDCCSLERNGICEHYSDCLDYDPDCCSLGECRERARFGCDPIKNQYTYCHLTECSGGGSGTGCFAPDSNCYGYEECGTGFCYNSTASPGFNLPLCDQECAPNSELPLIVRSYDSQSCCDCWDEPSSQCIACDSIPSCFNLTSDGYAIYSGESVSISYKLNASGCPAASVVKLSLGGPLRNFVTFPNGNKLFRVETGLYKFSAVVSKLPSYIPSGLYQLKVGARIDNADQGADIAQVIVTPSLVFETGRDVRGGMNVGYVSKLAPMSYRDDIVPVRVEVWVW